MATKEKTFSSYNKQQGQEYSQIRPDYHPDVYATVLERHTSSGGQLGTLVDVGCGPGLATKKLAAHFDHVIGLDPSSGMIESAKTIGLRTKSGEDVRFAVSSAEELSGVEESSVDLITAANAAHWFDMPRFWQSASRVLKPSGTVVLWTSGDIRAHPQMTAAAELDAAMEEWDKEMEPYFTDGNRLVVGGYRELVMPWPSTQGFDEQHFERIDWDHLKPFFTGPDTMTFDQFEATRGSASFVVRWRQAHPELVGTEQDTVRRSRREMERILHAAGVEPGKEKLKGAIYGVILVVKKV